MTAGRKFTTHDMAKSLARRQADAQQRALDRAILQERNRRRIAGEPLDGPIEPRTPSFRYDPNEDHEANKNSIG